MIFPAWTGWALPGRIASARAGRCGRWRQPGCGGGSRDATARSESVQDTLQIVMHVHGCRPGCMLPPSSGLQGNYRYFRGADEGNSLSETSVRVCQECVVLHHYWKFHTLPWTWNCKKWNGTLYVIYWPADQICRSNSRVYVAIKDIINLNKKLVRLNTRDLRSSQWRFLEYCPV